MALASAGHKLGQIVGDWWEEHVVLTLLNEVGSDLDLFIDNRFVERTCRDKKIVWPDYDDNNVDYDYAIELGGTKETKGMPVGFVECFWRRGARHSKDKARDDTNKLLPMRETYPTARMLAIAACGEFTEPARDYVRSRGVELFFVAKSNIIQAFKAEGFTIDYADNLPEQDKLNLVNALEANLTKDAKKRVYKRLLEKGGQQTFNSFKSKISGALSSMPQEIKIRVVNKSSPMIFYSTDSVEDFLGNNDLNNDVEFIDREFEYTVVYSDGTEFNIAVNSVTALLQTHKKIMRLEKHMLQVNTM